MKTAAEMQPQEGDFAMKKGLSIQEKLKDTDIICIGANMENFHTVNEVTYIDSWIKEYKIILKMLGN